jgi:hypothetical protein
MCTELFQKLRLYKDENAKLKASLDEQHDSHLTVMLQPSATLTIRTDTHLTVVQRRDFSAAPSATSSCCVPCCMSTVCRVPCLPRTTTACCRLLWRRR